MKQGRCLVHEYGTSSSQDRLHKLDVHSLADAAPYAMFGIFKLVRVTAIAISCLALSVTASVPPGKQYEVYGPISHPSRSVYFAGGISSIGYSRVNGPLASALASVQAMCTSNPACILAALFGENLAMIECGRSSR